MESMESIIDNIQDTPVPTVLILAGLFFVLLGFVDKLGGVIEVSQGQKRWAIPIGLFILTIGLAVYFNPVDTTSSESPPNSDQLVTAEPNADASLNNPSSNSQPNSEQLVTAKPDADASLNTPVNNSQLNSPEVPAVINDPDGYTNVRAGQGINYEIKFRIDEGEVFYTTPQTTTDWWPVRTEYNRSGYMHKSRIDRQD